MPLGPVPLLGTGAGRTRSPRSGTDAAGDPARPEPPRGRGPTPLIAVITGRIPRRNKIRFREAFAAEYPGNKAKAAAVAQAIRESGLQPTRPRAPLPPIGEEEVHLNCWMGIEVEK